MTTLYERIGGEAAVDKAVDIFYEKVLADERINSFFENIDMFAQARKQKAFLTMVFGGPNDYTGEDMRNAHAGMGLNDEHFNAVVEDLAATLSELGVGDGDIQEVANIAESVRDDVLNR
ncbi:MULTISPECIES: group 1 truncated hemoglobin [unclassified Spongiibacter]|jgi:truncated hemoglobin YjbI|uniref:group I truncated hemoglobin n=1 Tax=Spongiibacter TaxID=630749 RepID=UPI000C0A2BEE|nr:MULTISPECIES: group 1 truncated hemoglobin [unclassified Spongiibacter]MAK42627.1 group 1 truncated hemoglobin [Spongiibacter sp.]|tara:strand:- start:1739 stop:2095 length:357 start_codon:yes stop_codon:yes gene_type:complete